MMYVNKSVPGEQFSQLTEALRAIGIPEDTLRIMREYLDLDKPRNDALLDQITTQQFSSSITWERRNRLEKAIQKEINRPNQTELFERYILVCYAMAGSYCMQLQMMSFSMPFEEVEKLILHTFQARYPLTAKARVLACLATYWATGTRYYYSNFRTMVKGFSEDPAVCNDAIDCTPENDAKLYLVLMALHVMNLQTKNLIFKPSVSLRKEILQHMDEMAVYKWNTSERLIYMLMAMAEASCLDKKYLKILDQKVQNDHKLIGKIAKYAVDMFHEKAEHILWQLNALRMTDPEYISLIANYADIDKFRDKLLKQLAEKFPWEFREQVKKEIVCAVAEHMKKIYLSVYPDFEQDFSIQKKTQLRILKYFTENNNCKSEITGFLMGTLPMEEFLKILPNLEKQYFSTESVQYTQAYGMDDFSERCVCFYAFLAENLRYSMSNTLGFQVSKQEKAYIDILRKQHVPAELILNACAGHVMSYYTEAAKTEAKDRVVRACAEYMQEFLSLDLKQLTADARCLYVQMLGENGKYKYLSELFAMTSDSSKNVRNLLIQYLPKPSDSCNEKLLALLQAKKIAQREVAVGLLEQKFPDSWREHVQKALEIEKNENLRIRLAALLGETLSEEAQKASSENLVDSLTKGNKGKKTSWLFETAFSPVHTKEQKEQQEVPEKYLQAIVNCYAGMTVGNYTRSVQADQLAASLDQNDLERFAQEVFSRWIDRGAEAKTKWVVYFTAIHGGMDAIQVIQHYIKDWSEHSRGAIAAEAVKALAYNGSSAALMQVDAMARKFKNKQVRSAANVALQQAADILGITREELADKIIPDLSFDENLCRIFDYGTRQFQVYLTPALDLEIYEGEKKFKNLPKPGTKDDPEKSAQAVKDFKDMKKQMKAAIQSQKSRLEYALLCDRKWTVQGWKDLFIKNPVMHCFAIGLIWGVYQDQKLIRTFRYTEDGSFNTSDSDEYEFPEETQNIQIGLVHPVELEQDVISEWVEQLADYEITQPFAQLTRKVYKIRPEEAGKTTLQRFSGNEMGNVSLAGKMLKSEWSKGLAQDAGLFYEFTREDIASQKKSEDGKMQYIGYYVELAFEGMYIQISYEDNQNVTIGGLKFWSLENPVNEKNALKLEQVSPRYFSEIILQLTTIFGEDEAEHATREK